MKEYLRKYFNPYLYQALHFFFAESFQLFGFQEFAEAAESDDFRFGSVHASAIWYDAGGWDGVIDDFLLMGGVILSVHKLDGTVTSEKRWNRRMRRNQIKSTTILPVGWS